MAQVKNYTTLSYVSVSNSTAPTDWYADSTCTDGGGNTGWVFDSTVDFVSVSNSRVSPYDTWFLGDTSVDVEGNAGWGLEPTASWGYFTWS